MIHAEGKEPWQTSDVFKTQLQYPELFFLFLFLVLFFLLHFLPARKSLFVIQSSSATFLPVQGLFRCRHQRWKLPPNFPMMTKKLKKKLPKASLKSKPSPNFQRFSFSLPLSVSLPALHTPLQVLLWFNYWLQIAVCDFSSIPVFSLQDTRWLLMHGEKEKLHGHAKRIGTETCDPEEHSSICP